MQKTTASPLANKGREDTGHSCTCLNGCLCKNRLSLRSLLLTFNVLEGLLLCRLEDWASPCLQGLVGKELCEHCGTYRVLKGLDISFLTRPAGKGTISHFKKLSCSGTLGT